MVSDNTDCLELLNIHLVTLDLAVVSYLRDRVRLLNLSVLSSICKIEVFATCCISGSVTGSCFKPINPWSHDLTISKVHMSMDNICISIQKIVHAI